MATVYEGIERRVRPRSSAYRASMLFWGILTVLFVFLAINKQIDLQTWLTGIGRRLAETQGWYEKRRGMQATFVIVVGGTGLLTLGTLMYLTRELLPRKLYYVTDINAEYLRRMSSTFSGRPYLHVAHCDVTKAVSFPRPAGLFDTAICLNVGYRFCSSRICQNFLDLDPRIGDVMEAIAMLFPKAASQKLPDLERRLRRKRCPIGLTL